MSGSKKSILVVTIFVLLAAAALMASEKGTARFNVIRPLLVNGTNVPAGQYQVKWMVTDEDAQVTFLPAGGDTKGIQVDGKIEKVNKKFDYNALAIGKDSNGREVLKQIQFSGKKIRIVFNNE